MCLANGPLIFGLYFSHILTSGLHSPSFGGTSIGFPVKEVYEYAFATFSQRSFLLSASSLVPHVPLWRM
jgi:hypothetical protein